MIAVLAKSAMTRHSKSSKIKSSQQNAMNGFLSDGHSAIQAHVNSELATYKDIINRKTADYMKIELLNRCFNTLNLFHEEYQKFVAKIDTLK